MSWWNTNKDNSDKNFLRVILGLVVIFIIGYILWDKSEKKKILEEKEDEPENLEKLKAHLNSVKASKMINEAELVNQVGRRNNYFIAARLLLVLIVIAGFLFLQFKWTPSLFEKSYWIDNLRNFLTMIILFFTTIAFITKGNLKSFKESIEGMAIKWYFKKEGTLLTDIQELDVKIEYLEGKISQLELENSIKDHESTIVNQVLGEKCDKTEKNNPQKP